MTLTGQAGTTYFNPRSPRGGATFYDVCVSCGILHISIHAPHEGERPNGAYDAIARDRFQSTLPTRGSDLYIMSQVVTKSKISIHAPHEGERLFMSMLQYASTGISIHAPHEGERLRAAISHRMDSAFQSTLPTRGSDSDYRQQSAYYNDFNPRSPRGGATIHNM